jgi:hypothetical protein
MHVLRPRHFWSTHVPTALSLLDCELAGNRLISGMNKISGISKIAHFPALSMCGFPAGSSSSRAREFWKWAAAVRPALASLCTFSAKQVIHAYRHTIHKYTITPVHGYTLAGHKYWRICVHSVQKRSFLLTGISPVALICTYVWCTYVRTYVCMYVCNDYI